MAHGFNKDWLASLHYVRILPFHSRGPKLMFYRHSIVGGIIGVGVAAIGSDGVQVSSPKGYHAVLG